MSSRFAQFAVVETGNGIIEFTYKMGQFEFNVYCKKLDLLKIYISKGLFVVAVGVRGGPLEPFNSSDIPLNMGIDGFPGVRADTLYSSRSFVFVHEVRTHTINAYRTLQPDKDN